MGEREAVNESEIYESTPASSVVFILATIHIFPAPIVRLQTPRSRRLVNEKRRSKEKRRKMENAFAFPRCNFSIYESVDPTVRTKTVKRAAIRVNRAFTDSSNASENARPRSFFEVDGC